MNNNCKMILRHETQVNHIETWTWKDGDVIISYNSFCPGNYPSKENGKHTILEAMRQYVLLMNEGWDVEEGADQWHGFIEALDTRFWGKKRCEECGNSADVVSLCEQFLCEDCEREHKTSCSTCCLDS